MNAEQKHSLKLTAANIRRDVIESTYLAKSGHPGGSLSVADTLAYLYTMRINVFPDEPDSELRDRFVLSKGHAAPALYSVLAQRGFFPREEMKTLRKVGSRLQGHPDMNKTPGVDMSTGSLGQGISAAAGMALSFETDGRPNRVYAILGDGELAEGLVWEAAMFAAHYKLDNLTAIVDHNGLQIDGRIGDVMSPYPIDEKFRAFGWNAVTADAHDFDDLERAFTEAEAFGGNGKPTVIIQNSVKGKGVSFMENVADWHGKATGDDLYPAAIEEIDKALEQLIINNE